MKKYILLLISILVMLLSSCYIDGWGLNEEEKDHLESIFMDYIYEEEYEGISYTLIIDNSLNYTLEDGVMTYGDDYILDEYILTVYRSNDVYMAQEASTEMNRYYFEGELYTLDNETEETTREIYNAEDLNFDTFVDEFISKLLLILDDDNYDKYVSIIRGNGGPASNSLYYEFNTDQLIEDGIIEEDSSISLSIEFNLENEIYSLRFAITKELDREIIYFGVEYSSSPVYFPDDLDSYGS